MESLKKFVQQLCSISDEGWEILTGCITEKDFNKGDQLLKEGDVCRSVFFISRGFCKSVYNNEGKEINAAFYFEGDFATNTRSLIEGKASPYAIVAAEKMKVLQIDKTGMIEAYKKSHEIETFGRKLLEIIVARQEEHSDSFKMLTPQQRYEHMIRNHPQFFQRVSLTQAASYLGISRETLSRIRGR